MSAVEDNEKLLAKLYDGMDNAPKLDIIDKISASNLGLFEYRLFLPGHRGPADTQFLRLLNYVEDRVTALIDAWGKTELAKVSVAPDLEKTEDKKLHNSPHRDGKGVSQSEIDTPFR